MGVATDDMSCDMTRHLKECDCEFIDGGFKTSPLVTPYRLCGCNSGPIRTELK